MIPPLCLPSFTLGSVSRKMISLGMMTGLMLLASPGVMPSYNLAHAQDDTAARQAITGHPNVSQLRANICQLYAQADIARAGQYPQLDLRIVGGTSLKSKFRDRETQLRRFDDPRGARHLF